jgi:hypothetical protein
LVREAGGEYLPIILEAVERAPLAAADGHVRLTGSTQIVSVTNPA